MLPYKKNILFVITGSISAYKVCNVISALTKTHNVQVVATENALKFIGPATLEGLTSKKVISNTFELGETMAHIDLVRWTDLVITAPATANYINKISSGIGDDIATTLFLAHKFDKPWLIAPAMNTAMYNHPATQRSFSQLKDWGISILKSNSGLLACGEEGLGRLMEPEEILSEIYLKLGHKSEENFETSSNTNSNYLKKKILVTAGGTSEPIDGVRVISNQSTGFTGVNLSKFLDQNGYDVMLLHSSNSSVENLSNKIEKHVFQTFEDLKNKMHEALSKNEFHGIIHLAAVSDFSVDYLIQDNLKQFPNENLKLSSKQEFSIHLKKNPKLISSIREWSKNKNIKIVGFKLTKNSSPDEVLNKVNQVFISSHVDFVVHNDFNSINKATNLHKFSIYGSNNEVIEQGDNLHQLFNSLIKRCL